MFGMCLILGHVPNMCHPSMSRVRHARYGHGPLEGCVLHMPNTCPSVSHVWHAGYKHGPLERRVLLLGTRAIKISDIEHLDLEPNHLSTKIMATVKHKWRKLFEELEKGFIMGIKIMRPMITLYTRYYSTTLLDFSRRNKLALPLPHITQPEGCWNL